MSVTPEQNDNFHPLYNKLYAKNNAILSYYCASHHYLNRKYKENNNIGIILKVH